MAFQSICNGAESSGIKHHILKYNMASNDQKNSEYVARGLKAAIHNDNVSDDAKAGAAQRLNDMGIEVPRDYTQQHDDQEGGHITANQARGYRSVLSRGNVSEEAKEHAREMLDPSEGVFHEGAGEVEGMNNRVLGGYKATLKNPHVSEEAKEHAQEVLEEHNASS